MNSVAHAGHALIWKLTLAGAAVLFLLLHAPVAAQQIPGQDVPGQEGIQELFQEFEEKQQQLQTLQAQAMQENPELQTQQAELQEMMEVAMHEADPEFEQGVERLGELQGEMMQAQAEEDEAAAQQIFQEAQQIEVRLQQAQAQAMEQPEVREGIESFQDRLMAEITSLDPEADELLERLEELAEILGAHAGPPPGN